MKLETSRSKSEIRHVIFKSYHNSMRASRSVISTHQGTNYDLTKFQFVVTCQVYSTNHKLPGKNLPSFSLSI